MESDEGIKKQKYPYGVTELGGKLEEYYIMEIKPVLKLESLI